MNFVDYCLWRIDAEMSQWPDEGVDECERGKRVERLRDAVEQLARRCTDAGVEEGFRRCAQAAESPEVF